MNLIFRIRVLSAFKSFLAAGLFGILLMNPRVVSQREVSIEYQKQNELQSVLLSTRREIKSSYIGELVLR